MLRLKRGMTQEELAHECELDLTYVGGIERGRRNPTIKVIGRFASALGVHPKQFFEALENVEPAD